MCVMEEIMPKKRPLFNDVASRNKDNYRKIQELEFWRCEYTKRKYIFDFNDRQSAQEYNIIKSSCGVDLVDKATRFVMYHADVALGIVNDDSAPRNDMYEYLEQVIIAYHNFVYRNNPKSRIDDLEGVGFDLWELYDCLGDKEYESISVLHADARKYGFYPMDLIAIRPIDEVMRLINDYINLHGEFPFFHSSFPMDDKQDIDLYYKDRNGERCFVEENSADAVYLYIDCLNENETIEKIYKRIIGLINKAMKNKQMHTAGDRENSDIQICLYDTSIIQDKNKIKKILINNLLAYRNWHSPEFMLKESTIQMGKYLMVPEYESVPFHKRAAGLWIWDQVNFYKLKVIDAIEKSRYIKEFLWHRNVEMTTIERTYRLACRSIEEMKALRFSDL